MSANAPSKRFSIKKFAAISTLLLAGKAMAFDLNTGHAPTEVVIPSAMVYLATDVSKSGADATLVLRYTALLSNAWFDAVAPYHPTQLGVYSKITNRRTDGSNHDKNVSVLYATHKVLSSLAPQRQSQWDAMLSDLGLDPKDTSTNLNTPIGVGNYAGNAIVAARINDGMNQLGDEGGVKYNRLPYRDYTGYKPVNTYYMLKKPGRWQPAPGTNGFGKFNVQQFVTPQMANTRAYSFKNPAKFKIPAPWKSDPNNFSAYKAQVDEVLSISANLTDEQKLIAEFFDYKTRSLGASEIFIANKMNLPYIEKIQVLFLSNMTEFDTAIAVWKQKLVWDAVRPWSAIKHVYGNQKITAWGGPGKGTVNDIPASQWTSYLPVADHAEYPSGSAAFCAAHHYINNQFFKSDSLGMTVTIPAGGSTYEKGITPKVETKLTFSTWTDFKEKCGNSRLYGGVHFPDSITAGYSVGERVAEKSYKLIEDLIAGRTPKLEMDEKGDRSDYGYKQMRDERDVRDEHDGHDDGNDYEVE